MDKLIKIPDAKIEQASEMSRMLQGIRPSWQAKDLISRVKRLISIDPSSACQRLFNASIHDLREKVIIAGLDIAREAAKQNKLPPIEKPEDVEDYPTAKLIDLAHSIGLLTRPDWRRLARCYEIRRDLEHEDDEYEAGPADCFYIFDTCIKVVLSQDPLHVLKIVDVKELIEQPLPAIPASSLLEEYEHAPQPRQEEILKFLISIGLDSKQSDLVRQNAFTFLNQFGPVTQNPIKLRIAEHIQGRIKGDRQNRGAIRIAFALGVLPYIKQAYVNDFFEGVFREMEQVSFSWAKYESHGDLLRSFRGIGGLLFCPPGPRIKIIKWMMLAYVGEPGGLTRYGNVRPVFYSNTAAPLIEELVKQAGTIVKAEVQSLASDKEIKRACSYSDHLKRRLEAFLDLAEGER